LLFFIESPPEILTQVSQKPDFSNEILFGVKIKSKQRVVQLQPILHTCDRQIETEEVHQPGHTSEGSDEENGTHTSGALLPKLPAWRCLYVFAGFTRKLTF
jgi:hypothetical protein